VFSLLGTFDGRTVLAIKYFRDIILHSSKFVLSFKTLRSHIFYIIILNINKHSNSKTQVFAILCSYIMITDAVLMTFYLTATRTSIFFSFLTFRIIALNLSTTSFGLVWLHKYECGHIYTSAKIANSQL